MRNLKLAFVVSALAVAPTVWGQRTPTPPVVVSPPPASLPCVDLSNDPAGCQPSIRDLPWQQIPQHRLNRSGTRDNTSSPEDAMAGAFVLEEKLGLMRNFKHLHWIPTSPSQFDVVTGTWSRGDLDGFATGWGSTGLGIAGECLYVGRSNSTNTLGNGVFRDIQIFKIQPNPERNAPVLVGTMPQLRNGQVALRDRELRAAKYTSTDGVDRILLTRNATTGTADDIIVYQMDAETCLPLTAGVRGANTLAHEYFLWQDPKNPNRWLTVSQTYGGNVSTHPDGTTGSRPVDLIIAAITDENTGLVLEAPVVLANWSISIQGGPRRDGTSAHYGLTGGLQIDGRFANYSALRDQWNRAGGSQTTQGNYLHSGYLSDDGERFYAAGGTAGMFILNTEKITNNSNAAIISGAACKRTSTNVWVGGANPSQMTAPNGWQHDPAKLLELVNDCVHNVLIDDPSVQAMLTSGALSDEMKRIRYTVLEQRSRFDYHPPFVASVGVHSVVPVPGRPSLSGSNPKGRPAYVVASEEIPFGPCPERGLRVFSVQVEMTPMLLGTFAMHDSNVENCINQSSKNPDGSMKMTRPMMHAHNKTILKNMVFINWLGHGLRAIDISHPFNPREVGYARTVPWGDYMSYPDFKDGLTYVVDNHTGLHVFKYTGPRADEIPATGMFSGNISGEGPVSPQGTMRVRR